MNRKQLIVNNVLIKKFVLLVLSSCVASLGAHEPDAQMRGPDLPVASAASGPLDPSGGAESVPLLDRILKFFQGEPPQDPEIAKAIAELGSGVTYESIQKEADDALRADRRLLTPSNWPIGVYVGDLKKVPLILLDIAANKLFNDKLLQERKALILRDFKENTAKVIEVLEKVNEFQIKWEEGALGRGGMGSHEKMSFDLFSTHLLSDYCAKHHHLFGNILPHEKRTYAPLLLKYIWDKTSTFLHKNLTCQDKYLDGLCHSSDSAYKPDETGTLRKESSTPFSLATVLGFSYRFIKNPITTVLFANYSWLWLGGKNAHKPPAPEANTLVGRVLNSAIGFGMPDSYYSENGQRVVEFITLMFAAKFVDDINSILWTHDLKLRRYEALRYLKKYQAAHDSVTGSVERLRKAEAKLKKFIDEGHTVESFSHHALEERWSLAASFAPLRFASMTSAYIISVLAARGCMSQNAVVRKWSALFLGFHLSWQGMAGVLNPVLPAWAAKACAFSVLGFYFYAYYKLMRFMIEQNNSGYGRRYY